ncbi:AzlD domain-containing protein [Acidihalobacter ferrooxydans]|uniref:Branched-chain amino acid ABC transporter permease n=1 Tax=Acidihalobacter ferrooxydans TaxID=1765967 RepID=A0A1P8UES9_9GAMM|nr:AzlD domain-containing protein [Acidihalobacter ferrooxydans]APZ42330.1 branched-chain amino acid ABC transporter permease [Acidihalobacter ferrooxydans]
MTRAPVSGWGFWLLILLIGLGTFALRLSFIHLWGRIQFPQIVHRALRFIPAAVLAALVLPALLRPEGSIDFSVHNLRLIAGVLAAVIALLTRNVLFTIAAGMATLWITQMIH